MMLFHIFWNSLCSTNLKQCYSQLASLCVSVSFILPLPVHLLYNPTAVLLHTSMMHQNFLFVLQHTTCRSAALPTAAFPFPTQIKIQVSANIKKRSAPVPIPYNRLYFRRAFTQNAKEEVSTLSQEFTFILK